MLIRCFLFTVLLALALLGSLQLPAYSEVAKDQPYRLRAGDEVQVSVRPRKEYDCGGVILPDGTLTLINVGTIKAVGLTLQELGDQVKSVLGQKLRDPRITPVLVRMAPPETERVVKKKSVTVTGAVKKVGPLELEEGLRVRKALDLVGGTDETADLKTVVILHQDLTRTVVDLSTPERVSDPENNRLLKDGDSVEVRKLPELEKPVVVSGSARIGGSVATPGQYELKPGMTLQDLIITAGRLSPLADVEHVQFQRRDGPIGTINLVEQLRLGLKGKVLLEPGDEFFIPEQKDRVILIGNVPEPGAKAMIPGQTIRAFFLDGQKDTSATLNPGTIDLKNVELIRPGQEARKLDLAAVLKKEGHKDNVQLAAGDVLFLPPRSQKQKKGPLEFLQNIGPLGLLFSFF